MGNVPLDVNNGAEVFCGDVAEWRIVNCQPVQKSAFVRSGALLWRGNVFNALFRHYPSGGCSRLLGCR
jgi:hypothetical protein